MPIIITEAIQKKLLDKHNVSRKEVEDCFVNREGGLLIDDRENHKTNPQTQWFIAPTNGNRFLKVVFVQDGADIYIKTAYEANTEEIRIYDKYAK